MDYGEAIRLNPQFAGAYYNRGVARAAQGDRVGAIADYGEAIRLDPQYAVAYYNRGELRAEMDPAGAISDLREYLALGGGERDGDTAEVEDIIRALEKAIKK